MPIKKFQNFVGWLNLNQPTDIEDNELTIAKNVFYNNSKQIQTRRWYRKFGNQIGSDPITSYFFYQRDDTLERIALCHSWWTMYEYDGTTWNSVKTDLQEFETIPGLTDRRVRTDYAVYKNVVYMMDGVNPYAYYDGTTYNQIGIETAVTCTFDSTTDQVNKTAHWLTENSEVIFFTTWTIPAELNLNQVYYVIEVDADNFQVTDTPFGTAIDFTDDGTGTNTYSESNKPRARYIEFLNDTMFAASDDANPNTLYRTNTGQANSFNINQNVLVVWWDEQGRINGISIYSSVVLTFKTDKIYGVNIATPDSTPVDTQGGWYANRSIKNVGNSLVYFSERGVDTLQRRSWVDGVQAIESEPLSENVRKLMEMIQEKNYNSWSGIYIRPINNYYFAFDTDWDDRPDTVLVYNSTVSSWTQYTLPALYEFGQYINSDNERQFLFASASGWQMYQFEYGFDDDGTPIETEIQTKQRDFDDPAQLKMFQRVDVSGYKQEGQDMDIKVLIEWQVAVEWQVTDTNIDFDAQTGTLGVDANGIQSLWVAEGDDVEGLTLYPFTVRLPVMQRGIDIAVNVSATWTQRIVDKMRVWLAAEVVQIFGYNNII